MLPGLLRPPPHPQPAAHRDPQAARARPPPGQVRSGRHLLPEARRGRSDGARRSLRYPRPVRPPGPGRARPGPRTRRAGDTPRLGRRSGRARRARRGLRFRRPAPAGSGRMRHRGPTLRRPETDGRARARAAHRPRPGARFRRALDLPGQGRARKGRFLPRRGQRADRGGGPRGARCLFGRYPRHVAGPRVSGDRRVPGRHLRLQRPDAGRGRCGRLGGLCAHRFDDGGEPADARSGDPGRGLEIADLRPRRAERPRSDRRISRGRDLRLERGARPCRPFGLHRTAADRREAPGDPRRRLPGLEPVRPGRHGARRAGRGLPRGRRPRPGGPRRASNFRSRPAAAWADLAATRRPGEAAAQMLAHRRVSKERGTTAEPGVPTPPATEARKPRQFRGEAHDRRSRPRRVRAEPTAQKPARPAAMRVGSGVDAHHPAALLDESERGGAGLGDVEIDRGPGGDDEPQVRKIERRKRCRSVDPAQGEPERSRERLHRRRRGGDRVGPVAGRRRYDEETAGRGRTRGEKVEHHDRGQPRRAARRETRWDVGLSGRTGPAPSCASGCGPWCHPR